MIRAVHARNAFASTLLMAACSVPNLEIVEQASVRTARDASAADSDAGSELDAARPDALARDAGPPVRTGEPSSAGTAAGSVAGQSGRGAAGSGGTAAGVGGAGQAGANVLPVAGMAGAAGAASAPVTSPTRSCIVWNSINIRNGPPAGAIEGGFENIAGVITRQYVCRLRPAGSTYAIPGKYVDRLGCYVVQRSGGQVNDTSILDGLVDVLTPAAGCTLSWRAASPTQIPENAVDLGDPAGGRNYACRGDNSSIGATSTQVGTIVPSTDNPPVNQCWFESFTNAIQPLDQTMFEVLVLDPA